MRKLKQIDYIKKNIFLGYIHKVVTIVLEFILRTFFIKYLGKEVLSLNEVFINIIQVLSITEFGLNNIMSYSFYKPLAENNEVKIVKLINFYKKIYHKIALGIFLFGVLIIPFLNKIINIETVSTLKVILMYILVLVDTSISYLFIYKSVLLQSDQKKYILLKYEILFNIIRVSLQIFSLIVWKSIIFYFIFKIVFRIITNFKISSFVDKNYIYLKANKSLNLTSEEKIKIFKIIKSGIIYKLSSILMNSTDNIIISVICGTIWVGYLSNYNTIITGVASIYVIFFSALTSSIGNIFYTTNINTRKKIFEKLVFISNWLGIVLAICFNSLANEFINIWLDKKFLVTQDIVLVRSILLMLSCSLQPLFSFREVLGLYQRTKYIILISALINIILSVVLGDKIGVLGVLLASIISIVTTYFWYEPYIIYKEYFSKKVINYLLKRINDFFILFLGLYIFYKLSSKYLFYSQNIYMWLMKGVIIFFLANIYCFIFFLGRKEMKEIKEYLKKIKK